MDDCKYILMGNKKYINLREKNNMNTEIKFISRHSLTECQKLKAQEEGFQILECIDTETFDSVDTLIKKYSLKSGDIIGGVFPAPFIWRLQKKGICVLIFSSINRGERVDQVTDLSNLSLDIFEGIVRTYVLENMKAFQKISKYFLVEADW